MRNLVRLLRSLGGAGAVANARRACREIQARERVGDEVARRLEQRRPVQA